VSINILPNYFEYCDPQITKTDWIVGANDDVIVLACYL
jgi:hypothetical protein